MARFRPNGMIRTDFCVSYNSVRVNNESGRHRQGPGIITIVFGHIDTELKIKFFQVFRKGIDEAICFGDIVSRITQQFKLMSLEKYQFASLSFNVLQSIYCTSQVNSMGKF